MNKISFFTPVSFEGQDRTLAQKALTRVDGYLSLSNQKAVVVSKLQEGNRFAVEITKKESPLYLTALKVVSYLTLVLPLIALAIKTYLRSQYNFVLEAKKAESPESLKTPLTPPFSSITPPPQSDSPLPGTPAPYKPYAVHISPTLKFKINTPEEETKALRELGKHINDNHKFCSIVKSDPNVRLVKQNRDENGNCRYFQESHDWSHFYLAPLETSRERLPKGKTRITYQNGVTEIVDEYYSARSKCSQILRTYPDGTVEKGKFNQAKQLFEGIRQEKNKTTYLVPDRESPPSQHFRTKTNEFVYTKVSYISSVNELEEDEHELSTTFLKKSSPGVYTHLESDEDIDDLLKTLGSHFRDNGGFLLLNLNEVAESYLDRNRQTIGYKYFDVGRLGNFVILSALPEDDTNSDRFSETLEIPANHTASRFDFTDEESSTDPFRPYTVKLSSNFSIEIKSKKHEEKILKQLGKELNDGHNYYWIPHSDTMTKLLVQNIDSNGKCKYFEVSEDEDTSTINLYPLVESVEEETSFRGCPGALISFRNGVKEFGVKNVVEFLRIYPDERIEICEARGFSNIPG